MWNVEQHLRERVQQGHAVQQGALLRGQLGGEGALDGSIHGAFHNPQTAHRLRPHRGRTRRAVEQRQLAEAAAQSMLNGERRCNCMEAYVVRSPADCSSQGIQTQ